MSNREIQKANPKTKYAKIVAAGALVWLSLVPLGQVAGADEGGRGGDTGSDTAVRLLALTPIPPTARNNTAGAMYSFDISYVDQGTQTYYLADRSNAAVDVVDAKTGQLQQQISANPPFQGFTGSNDTSGPNGVVAAFPCLFATDGTSRVVGIDLRTNTTAGDVSTGGVKRADELAYDPQDHLLLVINNADSPPFGTFVGVDPTTCKLTVGKRLTFDAAHGVDAQNGAEQPVWDPGTRRFYLSIPQIGPSPQNGGVVRINPLAASVEATYPVQFCGPAGLTLGPREDLFIGCNMVFDTNGNVWDPNGTVPAAPRDVIIDAKTGHIDATVLGVGAGDEVWFNSGDGNYYATGSGSPERPLPAATAKGSTPAGVVDARDERLVQLFPTYNVPAMPGPNNIQTGPNFHPAGTSHSIAANSHNNLVFVPLPANNAILSPDGTHNCLTGCVGIFGHPDEDSDHHDR